MVFVNMFSVPAWLKVTFLGIYKYIFVLPYRRHNFYSKLVDFTHFVHFKLRLSFIRVLCRYRANDFLGRGSGLTTIMIV